MPRQRPKASDRINLPRSKADEYFDSVEVKPDSQSTSQLVNQPTSQPVALANSQLSEESIELDQESEDKHLREEAQPTALSDNKPTTQEYGKLKSQQVKKLKKATFQLSEALLKELDTFHLKLQLELGKENAPYKEVVVEEAIAQLLKQYQDTPQETLSVLQARQANRT